MKNKCIAIILILVGLLSLVGCAEEEKPENFIKCEWVYCGTVDRGVDGDLNIYYDTQTKVMYATSGYKATVLLNTDGTPMLYEEDTNE